MTRAFLEGSGHFFENLPLTMEEQNLFDESGMQFLSEYLANAAPSGFEAPGQKLWLEYLRPYIHDYIVDSYGSVAGIINPGCDYKVVIEAHADEIAWFVNHITDDGFIYVKKIGGADHQIPPSKRAFVHTKEGRIPVVFGWPAIHSRGGNDEVAPVTKNLFVDAGCTAQSEVANLGIHVGCPITFADELEVLNERYLAARALDNRIGGFMIAQVARQLHLNEENLPFTLYIVNSVQEEVGQRGAQMMAERLKPDLALITDVCHDTQTPRMNTITEGDVRGGKGPAITYGPAVQYNVVNQLESTAEEKAIPYQRRTTGRGTGTDTDAFAYSNQGVPSALISLPIRYMHTTVEMTRKDDVAHVVSLFYHSLLSIEANQDFRYFH